MKTYAGGAISVVHADSDPNTGWLFHFGAYGATNVAVLGLNMSLDKALEEAFEWLDDNAPGLLCSVYENAKECAEGLGFPWPLPADFDHSGDDGSRLYDACAADMTVCGHTTLRHGDCVPSWEWSVTKMGEREVAELVAEQEAREAEPVIEGE
jgi:hypothetical protein